MRHFCTYFDRNYLVRGLTLYRSLERWAGPFTLWVLCFDEATYQTLRRLGLACLRPVTLEAFEDNELRAVKPTRSRVEYFFTCTPSWPRYLLQRFPEIELLTYLDSDVFFFSDPEPIYRELGAGSVLIAGHRFPPFLRHLEETTGVYNVSLMAFRNDVPGRGCLTWWRERCLEWCFDRAEAGRYADQKYLDDWPTRFPGVKVLRHKGAGLAPWNWMNYEIAADGERITVDGEPLVVYHFHHLKVLNRWLYDPCLSYYQVMPPPLRRLLYAPYVRALRATRAWLRRAGLSAQLAGPNERLGDYSWRTGVKSVLGRSVLVAVGPFVL
ncbi:MAG: glycosyl transferase [Gemmatimonadetes bacterium]|nr:glycosyl transferase [Gemmatimonadota bacterium]